MAIVAWVAFGSAMMYVIALALADEMDRFPGGPKAFAASLRAGVEAMRPLRWPADRLDTLGGYLTYHNVTLVALFLSIYAAVQGARAVRGSEQAHSLEEVLATGWSRWAVVRDRSLGFAVTLALITVGLGLGVAASMAAAGEPDLGGSLITMTATTLCALVGFALGMLTSQLFGTSRTAAGVSSLVLTALYVATNVWEDLGPVGVVRFVSPFHYANASRALVPGYGFDPAATAALVLMSLVLLALTVWAFEHRDYGAALWARRRRAVAPGRHAVVRLPVTRSVWTASVLRGRIGLLAWCSGTAAYATLMSSLQPSVMDAWRSFEDWATLGGGRAGGFSPEAQYMSLIGEIITPILSAYVVTQAAGWVSDLEQGRVEAVLSAPVSWSRLVRERLLVVLFGVTAITTAALGGLLLGAVAVDGLVDAAGLGRIWLGCILLGAATAAVAAAVVAAFRSGLAVTILAVFLAVSYILGLLVTFFEWPEWLNRLSVFGAFGNPYLEWPPWTGTLVLVALAVPGALLAAAIAERTPKVA